VNDRELLVLETHDHPDVRVARTAAAGRGHRVTRRSGGDPEKRRRLRTHRLVAYRTEWRVVGVHAAVDGWAVDAGGEVRSATLEEPDALVVVPACGLRWRVIVSTGRKRGAGGDRPSPFEGVQLGVHGDVRFSGLTPAVGIAPCVILVGEAAERVPAL